MKYFILSIFSVLTISNACYASVWYVGPTRAYTVPSNVMGLVATGDTVEIDSGTYSGDVGTWRTDSLIIRCTSGYAHLEAAGNVAQKKGIWVVDGNHTYIEGIEFSGCAISEADG